MACRGICRRGIEQKAGSLRIGSMNHIPEGLEMPSEYAGDSWETVMEVQPI